MNKNSEQKPKVAILMSVRDEEDYIDYNISYHLDLGFDYIFITNHNSKDKTVEILESYKDDKRVVVVNETDPVFDHAKIANNLLRYAKTNYNIDWFVFLDADEFLSTKEDDIHEFVNRLEEKNIPYATIGWVNALFDYSTTDYKCSPVTSIDTTKYFIPWPEKEWQEGGHFRKTIVKNHDHMEIVVGGHYVETGNNIDFFGEYHWDPFIIPYEEAKILHFEFRGNAKDIYNKWKKLAEYENDSTSDKGAPWLERINTIKKYVDEFKDNIETINQKWFKDYRTFWGTKIPEERFVYDTTLSIWYRKYFRKKIEQGNISSICLVRDKNLGDVIMTEPIAKFLSQYADNIYLATEIKNAKEIFNTYDKIFGYTEVNSKQNDADIKIKLIYELGDNKKSYIQSYMESVGFGEVINKDIPEINQNWKDIVGEEYILIAPNTSSWEEKKRNWGYQNYVDLRGLLEAEFEVKCILLEDRYSFQEMMSLIKHCKCFVGNDSGPSHIAQSFNKKSFLIFGATSPKYLHLSEKTFCIYDKNRHKLCDHKTRQEEIECCEDFCMERIRVKDVFDIIKKKHDR